MTRRVRVDIAGAVQGVGFRPFIYDLATRCGAGGFVRNAPQGVTLELEGDEAAVARVLETLEHNPPIRARIYEIQTTDIPAQGEGEFKIVESDQQGVRTVLILPDLATCEDCLKEMNDPQDRRYSYPFINCTNCGPRYTIIHDLPYDRSRTTMAEFEMCPACQAEYENPANRRFHAEPTCCPVCGPRVLLRDQQGLDIPCDDPLAVAREQLTNGAIVAVKGIGGFHLACDARHADAVQRLRERKKRDAKPFAVMARDLETVRGLCDCASEAVRLLSGWERPIVLLPKQQHHGLADGIAPNNRFLGVMLPYTPLHHLLLQGPLDVLVMTSGNISDEPIVYTSDDAYEKLGTLADVFLTHDRPIHIRTDDSVMRFTADAPRFLRRSRGYAPFPVTLPVSAKTPVLAVGAELSDTVCLARNNQAFLSHHIGDLTEAPAYESFLQAVDHLQGILTTPAGVVACDMHPAYASTRFAKETGLPRQAVQHHHAHIASVLAEHQRSEEVIGVAFDGLGWGDDGTLWGGEFMVCDLSEYRRLAWLAPVLQPGGDAANRHPYRMAYTYLRRAFGSDALKWANVCMPDVEEDWGILDQLLEKEVNCPVTTSAGRLFDAASALLGICTENTYHARAPMELEAMAQQASEETNAYPFDIERTGDDRFVIHTDPIIGSLVNDIQGGESQAVCAARFHNAIVRLITKTCFVLRDITGLGTVALSGGVMANAFLVDRLTSRLREAGFEVLLNEQVPPGDGGISLGQAAVAAWRLSCV